MNKSERAICLVAKKVYGSYEGELGSLDYVLQSSEGNERITYKVLRCLPNHYFFAEHEMTEEEQKDCLANSVLHALLEELGYPVESTGTLH